MQKLNLPTFSFKIKTDRNIKQIFDTVRKKYVVLTPEEWVRQNFIKYLIHEKAYPQSLLAIEMGLKYFNIKKRSDIVAFNNKGEAKLIVECKAPEVKVTKEVFDQIAVYNMALKVDYLIVTNGLVHYCCKMNYEDNSYAFLEDIPNYNVFSSTT